MTEDISRYIKLYHDIFPMLRYTQIVSNAAKAGGWNNNDVFYCPDETLLRGLRILLEKVTA